MAKYRKLPVVIEALSVSQIFSTQIDRFGLLPKWVQVAILEKILIFDRSTMNFTTFKVKTLEGILSAKYDDMIIQGVNGELYPCDLEIFNKTYELVK